MKKSLWLVPFLAVVFLAAGRNIDPSMNEAFLQAVMNGKDVETIRGLLPDGARKGADINARFDGRTALMLTTRADVARFLLDKGADLRATSELEGYEPIIWAAVFNRSKEVTEVFLERGADVNATLANGETLLMRFSHMGRQDDTEFMSHGNPDMVKFFLEKGANVNASTEEGYTALHLAAQRGELEIVKMLLKRGAKVNAKKKDGVTALMSAGCVVPRLFKPELIEYLIEQGAEVNAKDDEGNTALYSSAESGSDGVVRILIARGANVNIKNKEGKTALDAALGRESDDELNARKKKAAQFLRAAGAKQGKNIK